MKAFLKKSAGLQRLNDWLKSTLKRRSSQPRIAAYLASANEPRLHLGCGANVLEDWLNTDRFSSDPRAVYVDVTRPFPLPDGIFHFVLAEHIIEHVSLHDARKMLAECFRVLRPGGVLRVGTPDLEKYLSLAGPSLSTIEDRAVRYLIDNWIHPGYFKAREYTPEAGDYSPAYVINDVFMNYAHRFIYDYRILSRLMTDAGFVQCTRAVAGHSQHAAFMKVESHADDINAHLTLTIEASKAL